MWRMWSISAYADARAIRGSKMSRTLALNWRATPIAPKSHGAQPAPAGHPRQPGSRGCVELRGGRGAGGPDVNPGPPRRWLTNRGEESFCGDEIGGFEPLGEAAVGRRCRDLDGRPPDCAHLPDFRNLVAAGRKALNGAYVRFCSDLRPMRYPPKSDIKPPRSPLPIVHSLSTAIREGRRGRSSRGEWLITDHGSLFHD